MDENFRLLTRGSVILVWSPSGLLRRYVVQHANVPTATGPLRGDVVSVGYDVIEIDENDNLLVGVEHFTEQDIEEAEGFGSSFTYMLGDVYHLPDFLT